MDYILPTTREKAIEILGKRQRRKQAKTKYDMLLGGLVCCSDEEFWQVIWVLDELNLIPCDLCNSKGRCFDKNSGHLNCIEMQEETLSMKWNANLYQ